MTILKNIKAKASDLSITLPIIAYGYLFQYADYQFLIDNSEKLSELFFLIMIALGTFTLGLAGFVEKGINEEVRRKKELFKHYILSVITFLFFNLNFYFINIDGDVSKWEIILSYQLLMIIILVLVNRKIKLLNILLS
ncbi:hypothetical protein [Halobacillus sp. Nhm2S1]|uniref:hypothetical protein n=1 Tax=Halobacillus sp. Nhm2S1 TaxID=2866716 RepID=UPI001C739727|nr:hypothetical protein [Halobacillus sp. Nhm2S1]MBX0358935.1 hypothetical protein [Halobacillus sp. Nhm2S1]